MVDSLAAHVRQLAEQVEALPDQIVASFALSTAADRVVRINRVTGQISTAAFPLITWIERNRPHSAPLEKARLLSLEDMAERCVSLDVPEYAGGTIHPHSEGAKLSQGVRAAAEFLVFCKYFAHAILGWVEEIERESPPALSTSYKYDVALSFAGEDRDYVQRVADGLVARGISVFYDAYEEAGLWGKDLYDHLIKVYQEDAQYTVIFISKYYRDKVWTNHERRAAQARALNESYGYILPARFDDTAIEGLLPTIVYIDLRTHSPQEVCVRLCEKLGRDPMQTKAHQVPSPWESSACGSVTFDYASHNGRFRIGDGAHLFETIWSRAGRKSIYCYTDTPSIRGVALAPRGASLTDITDASALDFTSRVRMAEEGRFVVVQNTNGFYAALEIVDVKDDNRGDPVSELAFRYWILTDGGTDFSRVQVA